MDEEVTGFYMTGYAMDMDGSIVEPSFRPYRGLLIVGVGKF
jgi:hypothetical protein